MKNKKSNKQSNQSSAIDVNFDFDEEKNALLISGGRNDTERLDGSECQPFPFASDSIVQSTPLD